MPTDVIIDPSTGQIYWNDNTGSPQSISIKGDALNAISVTGYSASFSPGSSVGGTTTLVTFNDNSGTAVLVPGTTGFELGSSTLRWKLFSTTGNFSDSTNTTSLTTGAVLVNGGIAISANAAIGQTLLLFNGANYTGFLSSATGNTVYTLPPTSPATGTSVLQSTSAGILSWVPMTASSSSGGTVSSGTQYQIAGYYSGTGASVSGSSTFTNNTALGQVQILHTTASTGTSTGALQVAGGVGISGRLSFNQAAFGTTGIATNPTMAMIGQTGDPIYMSILEDNSISFEGSQGQLFSISPNLTTGYIWAVNDISGVPLLRASVGATIGIAEYGGVVGIGQTNPIYKLDVKGNFGLASSNDSLYNFLFSNNAASGSNSFQVRSANSILFYNSGNTFYTGFKSNASANKLYVLPATDGSSGQFLQTDGNQNLTWATASGGSGSGSSGVNPGGQYEVAYYASTGASVSGSSTLKNDISAGVVSVSHSTVSTNYTNGAFTVSGGVGIGGSLYVGGIGASISGVRISSGAITAGAWNGTVIGVQYGGTGQNLTGLSGILTISSGTVSNSTTSSAIASALSDETGSGSLVFNTQPSFGTGVTTGDATFALFNTNATTVNAFGAATVMSIGANTGKATFNSTDNSTTVSTGGVVVSGGAGFAKSISVGGYLQLFNSSNFTSFVSSATANTIYTLPPTSPATGSSVLQSTSAGIMSWVPMVASSSGAGSGTVAIPDAQYRLAYYAGTGASVSSTNLITAVGTGVTILGATNATSTTVAALSVLGGLGVTGNAFIGGTTSITNTTVSTSTTSGALIVSGGVGIGGSLFTGTGFSSSISGVILANNTVNASTYNKVTITAPASSATLTLADGSSLVTSGANSLTLTTTGPTSVTLPTSGTLVNTAVTSLASLTTASSLNSVGTISSGTWSATAITAFYGGTGNNTYTKGDILVGFGNTFIKLGVGADNFVLTASAAAPSGVTWASVPPAAASSVAVAPTVLNQSFFLTAVSSSNGSGLGLSTVISFVVNPSTNIVSMSGLAVTALTQSTSSTTGALIVSGGAGIGYSLSVGGMIRTGTNTFTKSYSLGDISLDNGSSADTPAVTYYYANSRNFGHDVYSSGAGSTRWRIAKDLNEGTGAELFSIDTTGAIQIYSGANYSGFRFSGSGQTIYTLPSQSPQSATGTSVLASTIDGTMRWIGMAAGGSGSPAGSNKQIQYNNSSSFGGASGFEYTTGGTAVTVSVFSPSGTGYTAGLWINAIDGVTTRVGIGLSNPAFELEINGEISATNKSFVIDHPTKSGMKLRYGSLEGPENGVYVRGELKGTNIIEVPDHWIGLVHPDSYTVHLTPIGRFAHLYVEKIENYNVFIADNMMCPIHCYYSVWAERKDIPKLVTEYEAQ